MPRAQVRRAIEMANELGGDLAVVTGDFITGADDPLEDCVEEIRGLSRRSASTLAMAITKFTPTPKTARNGCSRKRE
jgi:sugar phosphate isomerase/epimerase